MTSKGILFIDFHGTLCHDLFWRSLEPQHQTKIKQYLFVDNDHLIKEWMLGRHSSEDINKLLARDLDLSYDLLWRAFVRDCQTMNIESEVLRLIQSLRNSFRVIMLTDNMDSLNRFTVPALDLDFYFDDIVNSYHTGLLKHDNRGEIFTRLLSSHGASLDNSYLIDDSPKVCEIFNSLGGQSLRVTAESPILDHLRSIC